MRNKFLFCFLLMVCPALSYTQDKVGLAADPASGIYSIFINPAFSSRYTYKWHANIFSVHAFLETDYGYVSNANLFTTLGNINDLDIITLIHARCEKISPHHPVLRSDKSGDVADTLQ